MKSIPKGFRQRVIFLAIAPVAVIALALTVYFLLVRYGDVERALAERGQSLVRQLAPAAEYGAFSGNRQELSRLAMTAARERDVVAVAIYDLNGSVLASVGSASPIEDIADLASDGNERRRSGAREIFHATVKQPALPFEDPFSPATPPIKEPGAPLGYVVIELSRASLDANKRQILLVTILTTMVVLAAALLLARRLGRDVVEPVLGLQEAVARIRAGELDVRIAPHGSGTLASLETGFNEMAAALDAGRRQSAHALAHSEEELAEQLEITQAKREEAERASQDKSRFLAAASHDLRQPLHALTLFATELLASASDHQRRIVSRIVEAAGAMTEMLDALLEVSRLDVAAVQPQRCAVALGPLLETIADAHRQSANIKGLKLVCRPTSLWVETDPHLLRRMVGNLLSNAVRYTNVGGLLLGARARGSRVQIEVWDTGIGIESAHQEAIFREFYQVGNVERDSAKGLGLGLAIVARLGRILDHPVSVRSTPGRGSVFTIVVPRGTPIKDAATAPSERASSRLRIGVRTMDNAQCNALGELLNAWGYEHVCVCSEEGFRLFLSDGPTLLICDAASLARVSADCSSMDQRPKVVVLGEIADNSAHGLQVQGRISLPLRPARMRALLHHLLHEEDEGPALDIAHPGDEAPSS